MQTKVVTALFCRYLNADHIEFHKTGFDIFNKYKVILNAQAMIDDYKAKIEQEDGIYKYLRGSEYTEKKRKTDQTRDRVLTDITIQIRAMERNLDPAVSESAKRVLRLINNYRNIEHVDYDAETAGIDSILEHLATPEYSGDVQRLNMQVSFDELDRLNTLFKTYAVDVELEQGKKPDISSKTARKETDEALKKLTSRLTAIITIDGPEDAQPLLVAYNVHANHYNTLWKEHYGRTHAKTDITDAVISGIDSEYSYTGDTINVIPAVAVSKTRNGKTTLVKLVFSKDFTVSYRNNIEPGTATLFIDGIGKFTGRITTTFTIVGND